MAIADDPCAYFPPRMITRRLNAAALSVYGLVDILAGEGQEPPHGGVVTITQRELAEQLGFAERTINHAVGVLRRDDLLAVRSGRVYVLSRCDPPPRRPSRLSDTVRWDVWERDDFRCQACGTRRDLTVDHIIPRVAGGSNETENLQTLCRSCNSSKGAR